MTRNRTVKDKGRRLLTRAARGARNPGMSEKRRSSGSVGDKETKSKVAKTASKPAAAKSRIEKPGSKPAVATSDKTKPAAAAKAATKLKTRLKSKPGAKPALEQAATPPAATRVKRPTVAAEAPIARPRLRRAMAQKRVSGKRSPVSSARFAVGDVVRHKFYPFRGVVFDIDPVFANTEEWWLSIPEQMRPKKNQPFYHLLAENAETEYIAYVSEQNLLPDTTGVPVRHPQISDYFVEEEDGRYRAVFMSMLN